MVVTSVTDGDSIRVTQAGGGPVEVRLVGINAPEADECHFEEAKDYLMDAILGATVRLESVGTDRFGRILAFVFAEKTNVSETLVSLGHAIAQTPDPDIGTGDGLLGAEEEAAERDRGLWADDACGATGQIPPIRISDFDPNPRGPDEEHLEQEIVVISNDGPTDIDISSWVLRDESSLHRHVFAPGTRLEAGRSLTVTSASPDWDPGGGPVWNNDGDLIMLMDEVGRVVNAFRY